MLRTGRAVRNHLGDDGWRLLNRIQQQIQQPVPGLGARQARETARRGFDAGDRVLRLEQ
jgi:uncharacterized alpha-E superfamily protein